MCKHALSLYNTIPSMKLKEICAGLSLLLCIGLARTTQQSSSNLVNAKGVTIKARFRCPEGFVRSVQTIGSFGSYLQNLQLKAYGAQVQYYDKTVKTKEQVYISVVDMDLDPLDLQQCADAVMRLRGEYLFSTKRYDDIHFNYLSDGKPRYFKTYCKGVYTYANFRKYMKDVFNYANTSSLHRELSAVKDFKTMQVGDVFIQKGNPFGHAVIVVDMAENKATKQKMYLLAQSYMPAQDTQILINPNDNAISPWYSLEDTEIITPEWNFKSTDLKRFQP